MSVQPTYFIPHGGGPCFFMDDPRGVWSGMEAFLRSLPNSLAEKPKAILVVSGHWETDGFALTGAERPELGREDLAELAGGIVLGHVVDVAHGR